MSDAQHPETPDGRELVLAESVTLRGFDTRISITSRDSAHEVASAFLSVRLAAPTRRERVSLGELPGLRRFVCCYRYDPYWMQPRTGRHAAELPVGTLYALFEREDGSFVLVVPLVNEPFSGSLEGGTEGLALVLDSGDTRAISDSALGAFIAVGDDPHRLMRLGAARVTAALGLGGLGADEQPPEFVDGFGWCTWDSFYREVNASDVTRGLESFREGGVEPRFMILDDGWQSVDAPTNEGLLVSFAANDKFPGGLTPTIARAKSRYRIQHFLVWHAVYGYWGGVHPTAMAEYRPQRVLRWYCPEVLTHVPGMNTEYCGPVTHRPAPSHLARFYSDYHRSLAAQGVDGVKVDNQASCEGLAHDAGGRVTQMKRLRGALESSVTEHFGGALINCMSCAAEMFYSAARSSVTRTSTDFWPHRPETHGLHLYTNALVSLWFGEFVLPDWDMFQSGHPAGAFHAAARAVSGGPVYVSDKPDAHDFALLRRLVLSDGSVPRALDVARPTRDCLFADPTRDSCLLKVYNTNPASYVVAAFNARYRSGEPDPIRGELSPGDVPQLVNKPSDYAVYLVEAKRLLRLRHDQSTPLELDSLRFEIAVIAPIRSGFAPIGLSDKLNPGGTLLGFEQRERELLVHFRDGGRALLFAELRPRELSVDGERVTDFEHDAASGQLSVVLPKVGPQSLRVMLPE